MSFTIRNNGLYYLAEKVYIFESWTTKLLRRASKEEIETYHKMKQHNLSIVYVTCDNPFCDRRIKTTRKRKIKMMIEDPIKGKYEFKYCGRECQQEHFKALEGVVK